MKQYYLQIEIRYTIPKDESLDDDIYQRTNFSKFINSQLFTEEKECIDFGNKVIKNNLWMEQYPGYKGLKLERRLGYPLVAPSLKNGAHIFISVQSLDIMDFDTINFELKKFNIPQIKEKI